MAKTDVEHQEGEANPYAGTYNVVADADVLHREVQRHVDAALLDFASGIFVATGLNEVGDITIYPIQTNDYGEGRIKTADVLTMTGILSERIHDCTYSTLGTAPRIDREDVEPLFQGLEALIAIARSRYAA